jgi:hypothetical protein
MAFGQSSGPPASHSQLRELTELLQAAGHSDFRDARGPMGFTRSPEAQLAKFSDEQLAAELQRRNWVVMEP